MSAPTSARAHRDTGWLRSTPVVVRARGGHVELLHGGEVLARHEARTIVVTPRPGFAGATLSVAPRTADGGAGQATHEVLSHQPRWQRVAAVALSGLLFVLAMTTYVVLDSEGLSVTAAVLGSCCALVGLGMLALFAHQRAHRPPEHEAASALDVYAGAGAAVTEPPGLWPRGDTAAAHDSAVTVHGDPASGAPQIPGPVRVVGAVLIPTAFVAAVVASVVVVLPVDLLTDALLGARAADYARAMVLLLLVPWLAELLWRVMMRRVARTLEPPLGPWLWERYRARRPSGGAWMLLATLAITGVLWVEVVRPSG